MAILSNVNGKFAVDSTGAIQFSGQTGTSGYVLKSNGNAAPTWVDGSTVIGGPYLPLSGGTLTGATATASGISFTVGGVLTGQANSNTFGTASASGRALIVQSGSSNQAIMLKNNLGGDGTISATGTATTMNYSFGTYSVAPALFIQNDGKVGIGTGSPDAKLHIYGSTSLSEMYLGEDAATDKAGILKYTQGDGSGTGVITLSHYGNTSVTQSLAIKYGGNVGIGTTSPNAPLDVTSKTSGSSGIQQWSYNSSPSSYRLQLNTIVSSGLVKFSFDQLNAGASYNNALVLDRGKVGIGNSTPNNILSVQVATDTRMEFWGTTQYAAMQSVNDANSTQKPMRFDASAYYFFGGSVGIGTDSPGAFKLSVKNTAEDLLRLHNSTDGLDSLISFTNPGGTLGRVQGIDNGGLAFDTGNNAGGINSNAMFIDNAGKVNRNDFACC